MSQFLWHSSSNLTRSCWLSKLRVYHGSTNQFSQNMCLLSFGPGDVQVDECRYFCFHKVPAGLHNHRRFLLTATATLLFNVSVWKGPIEMNKTGRGTSCAFLHAYRINPVSSARRCASLGPFASLGQVPMLKASTRMRCSLGKA